MGLLEIIANIHLTQGIQLSAHDNFDDIAIVIHPPQLQRSGRLYDIAADLMLLMANMMYVLGISPALVRQWAVAEPIIMPVYIAYPDVVPVGNVKWFLSEAEEEMLEQYACFEQLHPDAAVDVMELHQIIEEYGLSPVSPSYSSSMTHVSM